MVGNEKFGGREVYTVVCIPPGGGTGAEVEDRQIALMF